MTFSLLSNSKPRSSPVDCLSHHLGGDAGELRTQSWTISQLHSVPEGILRLLLVPQESAASPSPSGEKWTSSPSRRLWSTAQVWLNTGAASAKEAAVVAAAGDKRATELDDAAHTVPTE